MGLKLINPITGEQYDSDQKQSNTNYSTPKVEMTPGVLTLTNPETGFKYSNQPVVQDNPTPYAPPPEVRTQPEMNQAQQQLYNGVSNLVSRLRGMAQSSDPEPQGPVMVSQEEFDLQPELVQKYGNYDNYRSNTITDEYRDGALSRAIGIIQDSQGGTFRDRLNSVGQAFMDLRNTGKEVSESERAAENQMSVPAWRTYQRQKYGTEEARDNLELGAAEVRAAEESYQRIQDQVNALLAPNFGAGNIDLSKTPRIKNADGTYSYLPSVSYRDPKTGLTLLIPAATQISENVWQPLTEQEAISLYNRTGKYLGAFNNAYDAQSYANELQIQQKQMYDKLAELSALSRTAEEAYDQAQSSYGQALRSYQIRVDSFNRQYNPTAYYHSKGQSYHSILGVLSGLETTMANTEAGSEAYESAKRQYDDLYENRMTFATDDELDEIWEGGKAAEWGQAIMGFAINIGSKTARLLGQIQDPDGEINQLAEDRAAAGAERERRHALTVAKSIADTDAAKYADAVAKYATTGEITDEAIRLFHLDWDQNAVDGVAPQDASIISAMRIGLAQKIQEQINPDTGKKYTKQEAQDFAETLIRQGNKLYTQRDQELLADLMQYKPNDSLNDSGNKFLSALNNAGWGAISVLTNVASDFTGRAEGTRVLLGGQSNRTMDPNSLWFNEKANTRQIRQQVKESSVLPDINVLGMTISPSGAILSSLDSALARGTRGVLIGMGAAGDALYDAAQKGEPIGSAVQTAVIAGVFEGLFEAASIEKLKIFDETPIPKALTFKQFLKNADTVMGNLAKQGITNASEEINTELANAIFDYFKSAKYSDFELAIGQYMTEINPKTGETYTRKEATNKVLIDTAKRVGEAGLSGAFQGILMGGAAQAAALAKQKSDEKKFGRALTQGLKGNDPTLNVMVGMQFDPNSRTYKVSREAWEEDLQIDAMKPGQERSEARRQWMVKYGSGAYSLANIMAEEWSQYGPAGYTQAMHKAISAAVEQKDSLPVHFETPMETSVRMTQEAFGMSQNDAENTRRIILDVLAGRDGSTDQDGIRYGYVHGSVLTSPQFKATVEAITGQPVTGNSVVAVKQSLRKIASNIANQSIEFQPLPPVQAQSDLVKPTEPVNAPSAVPSVDTASTLTTAQGQTPDVARTPSNIPLNDLIRSGWYGNGQATVNTEQTSNDFAPLEEGQQTVQQSADGFVPMDNNQQPAQEQSAEEQQPKSKSLIGRLVDKLKTKEQDNLGPSMEIVNRQPVQTTQTTQTTQLTQSTQAQTGANQAAENKPMRVNVDGTLLTEEEFVRAALESDEFTEEQAREAFQHYAAGMGGTNTVDTSVRMAVAQSLAQNVDDVQAEQQAAEQGVTLYQYMVQETVNDLLRLNGSDNIKVRLAQRSELPNMNGFMDLKTGELLVNANAYDSDAKTMEGLAFILSHEGLHAADAALRKKGERTITDKLLGYTENGVFVPGVMQRMANLGAVKGVYARMGLDPAALDAEIAETMARYKKYYQQQGMSPDGINKLVDVDYIREEIANDFFGNIMGESYIGEGPTVSRQNLLKILAGIDDTPLRAAEMFLSDRRAAERRSGLKGKEFQRVYDSTQAEIRSLLTDIRAALADFTPGKVNGIRESISSLAFAMGIDAERNPETKEITYRINGEEITHVTKDHVKDHSGVGVMIRIAQENKTITPEEADDQYQAMADLMNTILKTQDPELYWNWAGATIFSAIRTNSDPQYSSTVDFSTVCRKTQDMLTAVSEAMMNRAKQNPDGYGGLTKEEITALQAKVNEAGLPVPCPVCYVFSRWAGAGGILDNINRLQRRFGSMSPDEINDQRVQLEQQMIDRGLAKKLKSGKYQFQGKAIDALVEEKSAAAAKLESEQANLELQMNQGKGTEETRERLETISEDIKHLKSDLDLLGEWQWVKKVATNPNYKPVPDYILYNLDKGEDFARDYNVVWGWRTTRGSGAGKAIMPYSEMSLGDFFVGAKPGSKSDETDSDVNPESDAVRTSSKNAFTSAAYGQAELTKDQKTLLASALKRVAAQNLLGGQRLQSTSDFRYEYALDYLQTFLEMQALGSKAQTYTKVREFVDFICSVGGDCNMSVMPKGRGYNDNDQLVFSNVTGMDIAAALDANRKFDNAQLILVGINDKHIELALEDSEETGGINIGFVIPYHTSGASIEGFISELVQNLGERIKINEDYWDYTKLQNDSVIKEQRVGEDGKLHWVEAQTPAQIALTKLRKHLLTGRDGNRKWAPTAEEKQQIYDTIATGNKDILDRSFQELRDIELRALAGDPKAIGEYKSWTQANVAKLYQRLWEKGGKDYNVRLRSDPADHVMPYEYWDTRTTRANAYINGFLFRSYCYNLGLRPRFTGWSSDGGRMSKKMKDASGKEYDQEYGDFSNRAGYWKLLIDRPMYANDGTYREQETINLTDLNQEVLSKDYAEQVYRDLPRDARPKANDAELAAQVGRTFAQDNPWQEGVGTKEAKQGMAEEQERSQRVDAAIRMSLASPEGLSNFQRRNIEFNLNETETGDPLKTVAGTTIKRYGWTKNNPDGVGKQLSYSDKKNDERGSQIYLHKLYAEELIDSFQPGLYGKAVDLLRDEYPDFEWNTVMYLHTNKRDVIRFDESPNFDTAREPYPGTMITVNVADGTVSMRSGEKANKQIWHHKWLWVKNDYQERNPNGFDVSDAWNWSKLWLSVIRDTKNKSEFIDGTNVRVDNRGIANGMGVDTDWWNEQLRYFGLPVEGEEADYDSRTRADAYVSYLKATEQERANAPQTDTSEDTSLNQVPASMTNFKFKPTDRVLDWGGGRYDAARLFMQDAYPGLEMFVYDPFNRTKSYNDEVLKRFQNDPATVVTVNNVLNVINSEKSQREVISESKRYLAPDGVAIFTIYEGDRSGIGEITKEVKDDDGTEISTSSWQNNLEAAEYVPMISDYYKYVDRVGNFILASDNESALKEAKRNQAKPAEKKALSAAAKPFIAEKYDMKTATELGQPEGGRYSLASNTGAPQTTEERRDALTGDIARRMLDEQKNGADEAKKRYSIARNSDGQQLSVGQEEYFKNSKVRDDDGNLLVMYHGTNTPGFTIFDPQYSDDKRSLFFTSNPMMANSYTRAQNWGRDVDPYNMITENSSAEDFNRAAERMDSPYRVEKITKDWLDDRRWWYKQLTDEILPYGKELYQIAQDLYGNNADGREKAQIKSMELLSKGQIDKQTLSDIRSLMFSSTQYFGRGQYQKSKAAQARLREIESTLRGLVDNAERVVIAADIPDSAIGQYVWEAFEPNDTYAYEIGTQSRGFSGGALTSDLKTVMRSALDRINMLEGRSFGNRYKTYVNLENPFILDAGTHIKGKHTVEVDWNGEGDYRVRVMGKDEDGYDEVVFKQTFENSDAGRQQLREFLGDESYNHLLEYSERAKQKFRNQHSDLSDAEWTEFVDSFYPETSDPIYIGFGDYFADIVDLDTVSPGKWNNLTLNGQSGMTTREVAEWAQNNGYDGVIFKNIRDTGGYAAGDPGPGTIAIAFSSNQVKSTDNLDPTENPDLRYSIARGADTAQTAEERRNAQVQDIVRNMLATQRNQNASTQANAPATGAAKQGFAKESDVDYFDWYNSAPQSQRMPLSNRQANNVAGERANRPAVQYPTTDTKRKVIMRAAQNIANSNLTDAEMSQTIGNAAANGVFSYIKQSNGRALDWAREQINEQGWDGAYGNYKLNVDKGITSKKLTALGIELYNNAVTNKDYYAALDIASLLIRNSHEAASALQAMQMLSGLDANGKLYMAVKGINNIADYYKRLYPKNKTLKIDDQLLNDYRDALIAQDEDAQLVAMAAIEQSIAKQLPGTWKERLNAWRYFAMLANPATHVRNFAGNLGFMPFRLAKQAVKAGLEGAFMSSEDMAKRKTTSILNLLSSKDRARLAAGFSDYKNVMDMIQSGGKQTGPKDRIEKQRQIMRPKALDAVIKANTNLLDAGDVLFSAPAYAEALASYLKARKIDADDFTKGNISPDDKAAAQAHAIKEAQKATYRDHNMFSDAIANIGQRGRSAKANPAEKVLSAAVEAVLPFKRTPANLMARAWEYSPMEIFNIVLSDVGKIGKAAAEVRRLEANADGSAKAYQAINAAKDAEAEALSTMFDHIASSAVGSVILALGMFFRHKRWVTGGDDEDEKQAAFDKLTGSQEYALEINGKSYTIDWLAPEILPFFTGVAIYDKLIDREEKDENGIFGDIGNVLSGLYEPMLNMSMLKSVNDLITNMKYIKEADQIPTLAKHIAGSLASQFIPTVFGKVENIFEDKRYSTYLDRNSKLSKDAQYYIGGIANKTPKWEYNQIVNYDAWGREQSTGDVAQRIALNLLSPGYYKEDRSTPYDKELQRLYDARKVWSKETKKEYNVLPQKAKQSQTVDGEYMSAKEYELYTRTQGMTQYELVGDLINSRAYKDMSDAEKARALSKVYEEAKDTAANAIRKLRGNEIDQTDAAKAGMNPATYAEAYSVYSSAKAPKWFTDIDGNEDKQPDWAKMQAVLNNDTLSEKDRLTFANAHSGRTEDFESFDEAVQYYDDAEVNAQTGIRLEPAKDVYTHADVPSWGKLNDKGEVPSWAKQLAVIDSKKVDDDIKLEYVNKASGRDSDFESLDEARVYYTGKGIYDSAETPEGYKTTEKGNTPGWAKALSLLDSDLLTDAEKLYYINSVSGLKEPFETLNEAREYYNKSKEKAKK